MYFYASVLDAYKMHENFTKFEAFAKGSENMDKYRESK